jgi:DNA mismatch endonuclease (patch repair protein)
MQGNRGRDTSPEVRLRSVLHRRGLRFRKHVAPLAGLRCQADLVFPGARVAVFVDGCFWHGCPVHGRTPRSNTDYWQAKIERNRRRDERNNGLLAEAGWTVVRVWEHEDPALVADRIAQVVGRR